ncbi:hypothetical protein MPH_02883 [Macrophomina phaseolina MS6]|uniref:Xylanolytic transcriptional activator regulatory domain-containing protein n=1 Tax=Macrophomina phaseolina (strain MS6) TaxID=1126212 RepID=K2SBN6_MACPH|nr:hypothetical protein MPH_02883 [Macrophomina phaseolina MS6]
MFNFRTHHSPLHDSLAEVHIRKELGDSFINEYFKTIHPQIPVLLRSEVAETWSRFWDTPSLGNKSLKGKELVLMVLALGARVSCVRGKSEASDLENWAAHFAERADLSSPFMPVPTLKTTHFLLLKASIAPPLYRAKPLLTGLPGNVRISAHEAE